MFGGRVFQQTVGIPMGATCAPLLADLFLYSYEADFIQGLLKKTEKKLSQSFNSTCRYIDDILSLTNCRHANYVDRIYPNELNIKDTIDTDRSASYLDLHFEFETNGWWRTKLYDKRDDFNFPIVNFPFICSNIPAVPIYGVYISHLIWYSRACGSYQEFLGKGLLLTRKLHSQWFLLVKLRSSLRKFYGRLLWNICETNDDGYVPFVVINSLSFPHSWLNTGFVTRLTRRVSLVEKKLPTLLEHLSSPLVFSGIRVTISLVLCVCFVDRYLYFCTLLGHCVVCSSSLCGFWLPLWYLQTLLSF